MARNTFVAQVTINITSLGPALFSNDGNIGNADNRKPCINLLIDNTNIIDCYKKFNVLLFKEALIINERKPTVNTGLKSIQGIATVLMCFKTKCINFM